MPDGHATIFCLDLYLLFCQRTPAFVHPVLFIIVFSGFGFDIADLIWLDSRIDTVLKLLSKVMGERL